MPIYHYVASGPDHCAHCVDGFDCMQRLHDAELVRCTECGATIERRMSAANTVTGGKHLLDEKHVAKNGFTQYRRIGKGVYEKTAGKGPKHISGD